MMFYWWAECQLCCCVLDKVLLYYFGKVKIIEMLTTIPNSNSFDKPFKQEKSPSFHTVEYGIQVDLHQNPENQQNLLLCNERQITMDPKHILTAEQRRKMKKKEKQKFKKEKAAQLQRQARRQIGNIIQQFYERKAKFQDHADKLQLYVELIYNNDFRDYLDQLIRMRVNYIQKSIWQYTQSILYENPFERNEDHVFYSQMVDEIYSRYIEIQQSSREIQKIINIYLQFAYQKQQSKEEIIYNNLAVNTFNYMIETDQTLKNLLHICDKKISLSKQLHRKKLETLISIIDSYYQYDEECDQISTNCPKDDLCSTGFSEEEERTDDRKKRRRKIKENDLICQEQSLTKRLNSLSIQEQERVACRVPEEYLERWKGYISKYKKQK